MSARRLRRGASFDCERGFGWVLIPEHPVSDGDATLSSVVAKAEVDRPPGSARLNLNHDRRSVRRHLDVLRDRKIASPIDAKNELIVEPHSHANGMFGGVRRDGADDEHEPAFVRVEHVHGFRAGPAKLWFVLVWCGKTV